MKDSIILLVKDIYTKYMGDNLISLILYGSRARNDHCESSDYDFYMIVYKNVDNIYKPLYDLSLDKSLINKIEIVQRSLSDLKHDNITSVLCGIAIDGNILVDTDNVAKKIFDKIREFANIHVEKVPNINSFTFRGKMHKLIWRVKPIQDVYYNNVIEPTFNITVGQLLGNMI